MPYVDNDDPGWIALQQRVAEAVAPFAAELGARECDHGDWAECDALGGAGCLFNDTRAKEGSMPIIQDFVLVATVADANTGLHDLSSIAAPHQRGHTTNGLLWTALNR